MSSDNGPEVMSFRAEPRLAKAIKQAASTEAVSLSDYIRTVLRLHLFDYATNHAGQNAVAEPRPTYE